MVLKDGTIISNLFEDVFTDSYKAERQFDAMILTKKCPRKQLWVKKPGGERILLKEEKFNG